MSSILKYAVHVVTAPKTVSSGRFVFCVQLNCECSFVPVVNLLYVRSILAAEF